MHHSAANKREIVAFEEPDIAHRSLATRYQTVLSCKSCCRGQGYPPFEVEIRSPSMRIRFLTEFLGSKANSHVKGGEEY
jgi:hypothetical protein